MTEDDLRKGFEANYGPRVRCLAIVLNNQRRAQQVFEMARKNNTAEHFGESGGAVLRRARQPGAARRGAAHQAARRPAETRRRGVSLRPGELSGIIQVGDKFVILRCEGYTKPTTVEVRRGPRAKSIGTCTKRNSAWRWPQCYEDLQEAATIDNYLAGTSHSPKPSGKPASRRPHVPTLRQMPGG